VLLENVERAIMGATTSERQRFERFLPLLATTGSTAPFIGLFGTVWGIMTSFQEIGLKGAANLAVVAPGISEALVATAMGLAAAIPAVVAFNHFSNRIRVVENEMSHFSADYLNMLKRDLMRKGKQDEPMVEAQRLAALQE
jgi:biopolymer transport protein TolQ